MAKDPYQDKLSSAAFKVCRLAATEQPFSGEYNDHWLVGKYICACCEKALFSSTSKFQSGCGWPSFSDAISPNVKYVQDNSHGMSRIEITCQHCDSHLGHVFDDGPTPTGKRYCVNSLSLHFVADE